VKQKNCNVSFIKIIDSSRTARVQNAFLWL